MKPDLAPLPFVLTQAEKSKAAWARIAIEHHVRERNAIEERQRGARIAGNAEREYGLTVEVER